MDLHGSDGSQGSPVVVQRRCGGQKAPALRLWAWDAAMLGPWRMAARARRLRPSVRAPQRARALGTCHSVVDAH
jgi:hypothetical protein